MKNTLKENRDFRRLYGRGRSAADRHLVVYTLRNRLGTNRLGITVGVKLGCAVQRNRVKRLIREAYRLHQHELKTGMDIVVVARRSAVEAGYADIERAFLRCVEKNGLKPKHSGVKA